MDNIIVLQDGLARLSPYTIDVCRHVKQPKRDNIILGDKWNLDDSIDIFIFLTTYKNPVALAPQRVHIVGCHFLGDESRIDIIRVAFIFI